MASKDILDFYRQHTPQTELGVAGKKLYDSLPNHNLETLVKACQNVQIHPFVLSWYGAESIPEAQRESDLGLRTAESVLSQWKARNGTDLCKPSDPTNRVVGNCRFFSTLLLSFLRESGVSARARCGFGTYFVPKFYMDHWVVEYWNAVTSEWILVDAQLDDIFKTKNMIDFDTLNVPRNKFVVGGDAYELVKSKGEKQDSFGLPFVKGIGLVVGNVQRDIAALNGRIVLPWDGWKGCLSMMVPIYGEIPPALVDLVYRSELDPTNFLKRTSRIWPKNIATIHAETGRIVTYLEMSIRVRKFASALIAYGIKPDDKIAFLAPNIPALLEAHTSVPLAGAVLVAINTRLNESEVEYILSFSESRILFIDWEYASLAAAAKKAGVEKVVIIKDSGKADDPYEQFIASGRDEPWTYFPQREAEYSPITLNFTSDKRKPKGVLYHARGAYLNAINESLIMQMDQSSVYAWLLPMFHCSGWTFTWATIASGATNLCFRKLDYSLIWDSFTQHGVTHYCGAVTVHMFLFTHPKARRLERPVRLMVAASAPSPTMLEMAVKLNFTVFHVYGLTETYGPVTICEWQNDWKSMSAHDQSALLSRQGHNYLVSDEVRVVNEETMEDVPMDGETLGEVIIRGNNVMLGYYKNEKATKEAFKGGWFHSGDLAVKFPDGYIQLKDRKKDIIISGGENISTIEVESAIMAHPSVIEAAWGESPAAYVALRVGAKTTPEELIAFCKTKLAGFKVPFNHTMYRVKDPKKSIEFYENVIGMKHIIEFKFPAAKFSLHFLAFGVPDHILKGTDEEKRAYMFSRSGVLELTHNWGTEDQPEQSYKVGNADGIGYGHIAIIVDDLDAAYERMSTFGVKWIKRPQDGNMKTIAFVADPDGAQDGRNNKDGNLSIDLTQFAKHPAEKQEKQADAIYKAPVEQMKLDSERQSDEEDDDETAQHLESEAINQQLDSFILKRADKMPKAIFFIIPNEFAERFTFYGISPLLNNYFKRYLGKRAESALELVHLFKFLAYFTPVIGAALSDSYFGKYVTIVVLSIVYILGVALLSLFSTPAVMGSPLPIWGPVLSLVLIAFGTGATPVIAEMQCFGSPQSYTSAFGLCALVMLMATTLFIIGKPWYRIIPPLRRFIPFEVAKMIIKATYRNFKFGRRAGSSYFDSVQSSFPKSFIRQSTELLIVVGLLTPCVLFWLGFDQKDSTWQNTYEMMNQDWGSLHINAEMNSNLNPVFIILLAPTMSFIVYPFIEKRWGTFRLLDRMICGMLLAACAFLVMAFIQMRIDSNPDALIFDAAAGQFICNPQDPSKCVHGAWSMIPMFIITCGEVLFSVSGLNFAYAEVGPRMKSSASAWWLVMVALGNLVAALLAPVYESLGPAKFYFLTAGIIVGSLIIYSFMAVKYVYLADRYKD
ncbi:lactoylglutathione lyase [Synchytrium microbalum]|uniref:Lactoylglutathione lyase n=1 Tax=Synchytrium microbalum TaxID=1806994 RepID=A0A507CAL4_9FUNG|nr:lactoylglutathione lyase [Synchytrium microbalum]TPX36662.1 lactoylglutathione lyase [Synchytrium microbalum]